MKLVEVEYEHSSNQLTIDAVKGHFITAINDDCKDVIEDLKDNSFSEFLKIGIHRIARRLNTRKKELNKDLILCFWEHFEKKVFVCKFDILHDIYISERNDKTTVVSTHISQHLLHKVCNKWANKLTQNYFGKQFGANRLYDFSIIERIPPCPWVYAFWTSAICWAKKNNLIEIDLQNRWILQTILFSFDYWSKNPKEIDNFSLLESALHQKEYLESIEPPIGLPKWEPQYKEKEKYLAEVKISVKEQLKKQDIFKNQKLFNSTVRQIIGFVETYCNKVEKHFRSNGWKKVTIRKEFNKHLEWTIRFQIKGQSYSEIAKEFNVYASSVKKEVEGILNLIGIKKREITRGRKKGQKTSETAKLLKNLGE